MTTIPAYCIRLRGSVAAVMDFEQLRESSIKVGNDFTIRAFDAIEPGQVANMMTELGLRWTYPWDAPAKCPYSGLTLIPYQTRDRNARMACFLSHYALWQGCIEIGRPVLIFEDDARFIAKVDPVTLMNSGFHAASLNDPRGATRCADRYHALLQEDKSKTEVVPVPWVDAAPQVPHGLPGHSAYFLRPELASKLVNHVELFGCWPNDALMCRQLFPGELGCLTNYATKVCGRRSTLA